MGIRNLFGFPRVLGVIAIFTAGLLFYYSHYSQTSMNAKTQAMLKMNYDEFDQSEQGWRSLGDQDAAKIIDQYLQTSSYLKTSPVSAHEKMMLYFHAGQAYAFIGDYQTALKRFRLSKYLSNNGWELSWNAYVDATIAFLEGDHNTLLNTKKSWKNIKI